MAVPNRYLCPITQEVMAHPMMDREGHNFERNAILDWLKRSSSCPMGREPLSEGALFYNRALKEEIDEWLHQHGSQGCFVPSPASAGSRPAPAAAPPVINHAVDPSAPWKRYKISQEEYDHVMCTFMTFDTDGSGSLDRDELQLMCKWLNYPHSDRDINDMFRAMDTDGSGTLDLHEFVTYMQERRPTPEVQYGLDARRYQEILMQYHNYDTDGNGELDREELAELCRSMRYPCSHQDIENMFNTMDSDGNGHLSLHEFLTYMKSYNPHQRPPSAPPLNHNIRDNNVFAAHSAPSAPSINSPPRAPPLPPLAASPAPADFAPPRRESKGKRGFMSWLTGS